MKSILVILKFIKMIWDILVNERTDLGFFIGSSEKLIDVSLGGISLGG